MNHHEAFYKTWPRRRAIQGHREEEAQRRDPLGHLAQVGLGKEAVIGRRAPNASGTCGPGYPRVIETSDRENYAGIRAKFPQQIRGVPVELPVVGFLERKSRPICLEKKSHNGPVSVVG